MTTPLKRVFAATCAHETHSFSVMPTSLREFATSELIESQAEILAQTSGTSTEWGGMIAAAQELRWDLRCGLAAHAAPSGPIGVEAFEYLMGAMTDALRAALPVDGVLLGLHGAMIAERYDDAESEILRRVRAIVGLNVPIAVTLDLHGNVTRGMVELADIITGYRTTPHIDIWETAIRGARLLDRAMHGPDRPRVFLQRPPTLFGLDLGRTIDPDGPMRRAQRLADEFAQSRPCIWDITLMAGYPYADIDEAGPSVVVTATDAAEAMEPLRALSQEIWNSRTEMSIPFVGLDEAVRAMRSASSRAGPGPTVVTDYSDGPGGAGYGDGVRLLKPMLEARLAASAFGPLYDPDVAAAAHAAGEGATIFVALGGKIDPKVGGDPLPVEAHVERLASGEYVRRGPFARGSVGHLGPSACLRIGETRVVVCSNRIQTEDREQFRILGIDPESCRVIGCKGINHFRADFEPIAEALIFVDTGGLVSPNLRVFPYRKVRRPLWPLDECEGDDPASPVS